MKTKVIITSLILLTLIATGKFLSIKNNHNSFESRREKVLSELNLAIQDAEKTEKYKCCIEPPCTMCYLGEWLWKDGTCDCDGMIAMEDWDKVCPQCVKGIKEGRCKSEIGTCPVL